MEEGHVVGPGFASTVGDVQGRITERQLPLAEKSFPGIARMYRELADKPRTFLQLLWLYETQRDADTLEPGVVPARA